MRKGVLAGLARNRTSYHNNFTQAGPGRKYQPGMIPWAWEYSQRCFTPVFRFRTIICGLWCIGIQLDSCCLLPTSEKKELKLCSSCVDLPQNAGNFNMVYGFWILFLVFCHSQCYFDFWSDYLSTLSVQVISITELPTTVRTLLY